MTSPSLIDMERVHHDFELIEKRDQPPATLAHAVANTENLKRTDFAGVLGDIDPYN